MKVYETILSILEKKGPLSIPTVCKEVNHLLTTDRDKPLLPSHIKSIVTRKKDLFQINDGNISINPNKYFCTLTATIESFSGISYQVRVNFDKNRFVALEWRNKENNHPISEFQPKSPGCIEEFKRELYFLKVWEWNSSYRDETGIVLDGKYWSIKLKTMGKIYESEGAQSFPANWDKFCKSIERLTGTPFH